MAVLTRKNDIFDDKRLQYLRLYMVFLYFTEMNIFEY